MNAHDEDQLFLADFRTLSTFGSTDGGGVERQAGTAADAAQRRWLEGWLQQRGFEVRYDEVGNQFGLLTLRRGAPWVLTGSHLDSQPLAGRFDGAYGVLASAHAADRVRRRVADSATVPAYNLAVVNWFNEEGSRFKPSMMGSAVFTGKLPAREALATTDPSGVTVEEVLRGQGMVGPPLELDVASFAEIHIEQGRILESSGCTAGLVEGTWATRKFELLVTGAQSHTGATLMQDRRDALLGAAMLIVKANELSSRHTTPPLHTAVSELYVLPNSPVTVAREVRMHVDLRCESQAVVEQAVAEFWEHVREVEDRVRVEVREVASHSWDRRNYTEHGVALAEECARSIGVSTRRMLTVAGHDSTNMSDVAPTVMLFVPSRDGISHNEAEDTRDSDATQGVRLLTAVVERLAVDGLP
jgi:beta-ureidopropionase / N-carbamoyl-L-amino-acid hydrolase